jgi:hypothetical protein
MKPRTLLAAAAACTLISLSAAAQPYGAVISIAPPAPMQEVIPPGRPGWLWAPGHYEWRGNSYVWESGHWMRERHGYEYREPRWVQRPNGSWFMVGGGWEHRWDQRREREHAWEHERRERHERDRDRDGRRHRDDDHDRAPDRHERHSYNHD